MRLSHYLVILAAVWMIAMTWHLYPQFGHMLRLDQRLVAYDDFIAESCGQRIGPAAETCLAEAQETARRLLAREQGKSVLFILAPLLVYLLVYWPLRRIIDARGGRR